MFLLLVLFFLGKLKFYYYSALLQYIYFNTLYKTISRLVHFSEIDLIMLNYPYPKFIPNDDDFYNTVNSCSVTSPDKFSDEFSKFSVDSYFSILHLNMRSCRRNFPLFHVFLTSLLTNFSIIALTETWLTKDIDLLFNLDGYNEFSMYRNGHEI